jgi:hypothetical protein
MRRHEPTDDNEIFAFGIPAKIMDWAFESLDLVDFSVFVVENIQTILTVVRLASGVVVGLQLHQELIGLGTEPQLDLLSFLDGLFVERIHGLVGKQLDQS